MLIRSLKMKTFTKQNLGEVRADINAALEAVDKKHGIQLSIGNITFTAETFSTKLAANIPSDGAEAGSKSGGEVKWETNFKRYARSFGFTTEDFGKDVNLGGTKYTIAGMRPKANQPVVLKKATGGFIAYDAE